MRLNRYMTQCPRTDARPARCEGTVQADKIGIAVQPFTVGDDGFLYGDDQPAFDSGPTVRAFWCSEGHSLTEADVLLERNEDTEPAGGEAA